MRIVFTVSSWEITFWYILNTLSLFHVVSDYDGRYTVPVLWDKKQNKIVSNESSEIIRMLNSEFNEFCKTEQQKKLDLYPEHLRKDIEALNDWIYP